MNKWFVRGFTENFYVNPKKLFNKIGRKDIFPNNLDAFECGYYSTMGEFSGTLLKCFLIGLMVFFLVYYILLTVMPLFVLAYLYYYFNKEIKK